MSFVTLWTDCLGELTHTGTENIFSTFFVFKYVKALLRMKIKQSNKLPSLPGSSRGKFGVVIKLNYSNITIFFWSQALTDVSKQQPCIPTKALGSSQTFGRSVLLGFRSLETAGFPVQCQESCYDTLCQFHAIVQGLALTDQGLRRTTWPIGRLDAQDSIKTWYYSTHLRSLSRSIQFILTCFTEICFSCFYTCLQTLHCIPFYFIMTYHTIAISNTKSCNLLSEVGWCRAAAQWQEGTRTSEEQAMTPWTSPRGSSRFEHFSDNFSSVFIENVHDLCSLFFTYFTTVVVMMFHRDFSENYNESMFLPGNFACFSSGCMLTFSTTCVESAWLQVGSQLMNLFSPKCPAVFDRESFGRPNFHKEFHCPTLLHSWSILKFWLGLPTCHGGKDFGRNVTWPDGGSPKGSTTFDWTDVADWPWTCRWLLDIHVEMKSIYIASSRVI